MYRRRVLRSLSEELAGVEVTKASDSWPEDRVLPAD
jgi:hypothetical protein